MTGFVEGLRAMVDAADQRDAERRRARQADDGPRGEGWARAQGPDATTARALEAVPCPRCGLEVPAAAAMRHGLEHRAADELEGRVPGGPPLARRQAVGDLGWPPNIR